MNAEKKALGRGLDALFADEEAYIPPSVKRDNAADNAAAKDADVNAGVVMMPIDLLVPGTYQPRSFFDTGAIEELAQSIKTHGVLQPLLVRTSKDYPDNFEIIAGERRWRAAQKAGLHEVPVIIREMTDREALEIGLIENVQRRDLSAIEEAVAYRQLTEDFGYTQEELAETVGKGRSHVANTMRLLVLPKPVQDMIMNGKLSAGHARALINADKPEKLAQEIIKKELSVRQTEKLVASHGVQTRTKPAAQNNKPATGGKAKSTDIAALEADIKRILGLEVTIDAITNTKGSITIHYSDLEQLDDVLNRLMQQKSQF